LLVDRFFPEARDREHSTGLRFLRSTHQVGVAVQGLSLERVHQLWAEWDKKYKAALAQPVPFGRHKGEMLKQVGKYDLRWLCDRIPSAEVVDEKLIALDILLEYRKVSHPREIEAAKLVEHPWRKVLKHERAVRIRRVDMRILDLPGARVLLGALNDEEKERLRDELLEQKQNRVAFDELRAAIEIALYDRPPSFPTVRLTALRSMIDRPAFRQYAARRCQKMTIPIALSC
jgi:hypothetical protein